MTAARYGSLSINLAAVTDADHENNQLVIDNFVDYAIVTDADAVKNVVGFHWI